MLSGALGLQIIFRRLGVELGEQQFSKIKGVDERELTFREIKNLSSEAQKKITIEKFDNLLVHYVKAKKASVIIRGLRAVSDFEYEFLMTGMNRSIDNEIETIFLMSSEKYHFISSRFIKEIHSLGGDISKSVPKPVLDFFSKI